MAKHIGILTAGGDSPGLNAAIRGVGKAAQSHYGMQMIGFLDGFKGLVDNRSVRLDGSMLSDILTQGGTILGTSEAKANATDKKARKQAKKELTRLETENAHHTATLSRQLEKLTGLESRVTILGHLQRGGTPSAADRLLATRLGTACADLIELEQYGVMVAARGEEAVPVPLIEVAGNKKLVPWDHSWVVSAKNVGTSFGH